MMNNSNHRIIKMCQLNKWYGNLHALKNVDLTKKGEVIGLLEIMVQVSQL